jgi:ribosomal protein L18
MRIIETRIVAKPEGMLGVDGNKVLGNTVMITGASGAHVVDPSERARAWEFEGVTYTLWSPEERGEFAESYRMDQKIWRMVDGGRDPEPKRMAFYFHDYVVLAQGQEEIDLVEAHAFHGAALPADVAREPAAHAVGGDVAEAAVEASPGAEVEAEGSPVQERQDAAVEQVQEAVEAVEAVVFGRSRMAKHNSRGAYRLACALDDALPAGSWEGRRGRTASALAHYLAEADMEEAMDLIRAGRPVLITV